MINELVLGGMALIVAGMSVAHIICIHKTNLRLMNTIDTLQRDQSLIISQMLAAKSRYETGDAFTAGQILQQADNHDRRAGTPDIPQSFKAGVPVEENDVAALGLDESPEMVYGDDIGDVPGPGVET